MDRKPQDHVSLSPEDAAFVQERFKTPGEVVKRALLNFRETDHFFAANVEELNAKIEEGLREIENGNVIGGEALMDSLDKLHEAGRHMAQCSRGAD
jgi:hypothetical protein